MNRRLWLVSAGVVTAGAVVWVAWPNGGEPRQVVSVPYAELPKAVYLRGEYRGRLVSVAFSLPPTPTADPLVWECRPGWPPEHVPPTYRLHFDAPPVFPARPPYVLVGTVEGIAPDLVMRVNGVPGVVVLRGCAPASP